MNVVRYDNPKKNNCCILSRTSKKGQDTAMSLNILVLSRVGRALQETSKKVKLHTFRLRPKVLRFTIYSSASRRAIAFEGGPCSYTSYPPPAFEWHDQFRKYMFLFFWHMWMFSKSCINSHVIIWSDRNGKHLSSLQCMDDRFCAPSLTHSSTSRTSVFSWGILRYFWQTWRNNVFSDAFQVSKIRVHLVSPDHRADSTEVQAFELHDQSYLYTSDRLFCILFWV